MLSTETIQTIKSTIPVLEVHGQAITAKFYELLFTNHPELLNIFNHANQKQGRQQAALANAVYAAAVHIDKLEAIISVVKQIGHKHRSLGVKAEHYPIVGEHLLLAMKEVLGNAATPEILEAWGDAYGVIAKAFIDVEEEMYKEAEQQSGGWRDFRSFIIARKVKESEVITSFYLQPVDGKEIPTFLAGQYISVKITVPGEAYTHIRQYSLSHASGGKEYRISVKREEGNQQQPNGIVSNYLHQVDVGEVVEVSAPAGDFVLDTSKNIPLVLLSGGVGLTPLVSMLHEVVKKQPDRPVYFIHATQNSSVHALRQEVEELKALHPQVRTFVCYDSPTEEDREAKRYDKEGYIDLEWLQAILPSNACDFYFCGPIPFMKAMKRYLLEWEVASEHIHFEFFGPASQLD